MVVTGAVVARRVVMAGRCRNNALVGSTGS